MGQWYISFGYLVVFVLALVGCGGDTYEGPPQGPPEIDWVRWNGPYAGSLHFEFDGVAYLGRSQPRTDDDVRPVTAFFDGGEKVAKTGWPSIAQHLRWARRVSVADTTNQVFLSRDSGPESIPPYGHFLRVRWESEGQISDVVAPDWELFDGFVHLMSIGANIGAFDGEQLFRTGGESDFSSWEVVSTPGGGDGGYAVRPRAHNGRLHVIGDDSNETTTLHTSADAGRTWSETTVQANIPPNAEFATFGSRAAVLAESRELDNRTFQTPVILYDPDSRQWQSREVESPVPLQPRELESWKDSLVTLDSMSRVVALEPGSDTRFATDPPREVATEELYTINGQILRDVGQTVLTWKEEPAGWRPMKVVIRSPGTLEMHDEKLWVPALHRTGEQSLMAALEEEYASNSYRTELVTGPGRPRHRREHMTDAEVVRTTRGDCLWERYPGNWRLLFQFRGELKVEEASCFAETPEGVSRDIPSVFAVGDDYAFHQIVRRESDDNGGSSEVSADVYRWNYSDESLEHLSGPDSAIGSDEVLAFNKIAGDFWAKTAPAFSRPNVDLKLFRLSEEGAWIRFDFDYVGPDGESLALGSDGFTAQPDPAEGPFVRIPGPTSRGDAESSEWLARWDESEFTFRRLPAPTEPEAVHVMDTTELGVVAATDDGIFEWMVSEGEWRLLGVNLPHPTATVRSIAAEQHDVFLGLESGGIWEVQSLHSDKFYEDGGRY